MNVTASSSAATGRTNVQVAQLATAAKLQSSAPASGKVQGTLDLAALDRKVQAIEADMQAEIDAAKAAAKARAEGLRIRRKELADAVGVFAKLNKGTLFREARTLDLGYGKIGFRLSTPSIVLERGVTEAMSLDKLRELGLTDGIRLKEELARDVLLGWPDERLALAGVKRQQRDAFFIDTAKEKLPEEA